MDKDESIQITGNTGDLLVQKITSEKQGQEFTLGYLKSDFLASAVDGLFYARRQAGLTQAQVAEKMNTKQASIARLEADTSGSMSLRRYIEYTMACGMVPLEIKLVPIADIRNYIVAHPESQLTEESYNAWLETSGKTIPISGNALPVNENATKSFATQSTNIMNQEIRFPLDFPVNYLPQQTLSIGASGNVFTLTLDNPSSKSSIQTTAQNSQLEQKVAA